LSVVRVQLLKQMPGAYLANVLEQLIEERCFVQIERHLAVVAPRRLPADDLRPSSTQALWVFRTRRGTFPVWHERGA
jgi:hypothetical protein